VNVRGNGLVGVSMGLEVGFIMKAWVVL
jgi:hypothetical protein